jgi:hypothetical protein
VSGARRRCVLSTSARANRRGPVVGEEARQHVLRDRLREVPHQQRAPAAGADPSCCCCGGVGGGTGEGESAAAGRTPSVALRQVWSRVYRGGGMT